MDSGLKSYGMALALAGGALLLAGGAWAQTSQGSAATRSLNGAPAHTASDARTSTVTDRSPAQTRAQGRPGVTLSAGQTEPDPIPITLGYYVRGGKNCDQVWPGDGDLAWMTPTAFVIDFGGCEPGQFLQTGPNSWREEQRCKTELGDDAGAYEVAYEVVGADVIKREARLGIDDSVEADDWKHCPAEDVPENARFKS